MSLSHINIIIDRISVAEKESPIAVFKSMSANHLDALFASTVDSQKAIANNSTGLVGLFDSTMDMREVRRELIKAVK